MNSQQTLMDMEDHQLAAMVTFLVAVNEDRFPIGSVSRIVMLEVVRRLDHE